MILIEQSDHVLWTVCNVICQCTAVQNMVIEHPIMMSFSFPNTLEQCFCWSSVHIEAIKVEQRWTVSLLYSSSQDVSLLWPHINTCTLHLLLLLTGNCHYFTLTQQVTCQGKDRRSHVVVRRHFRSWQKLTLILLMYCFVVKCKIGRNSYHRPSKCVRPWP